MKLLYLFHEYRHRRKRYGDEMAALGHDVTFHHIGDKYRGPALDPHLADGFDMVWALSASYTKGPITSRFVRHCRNKKIPLVTYTTNSMSIPEKEYVKCYDHFDWIFLHNETFVERTRELLKRDKDIQFMPVGYYPDLYRPPKEGQSKRKYPITFAGSSQTLVEPKDDRRANVLRELIKAFPNMRVYGSRICNRAGAPMRKYSSHKEQLRIYWISKICLDLPYMNTVLPEYQGIMHLKNRSFEIPGSQSLLLTADTQEMRKLYPESSAVFYYDPRRFDSLVAECQRIFDYWPAMEEKMIMAQEHAKKNHTFYHRFKKMFEIMGCT